MIVYGPRVNVHPDRMGADRGTDIRYLILHTSEQAGAEDPNDAEDLGRYLESPGDRPTSSGGVYGSSYHGITDTGRVLPCVHDTVVAYAAGGGNRHGLHLCLPVKAGQTRAQWLDATSRPYIRQAAAWIVDKATGYNVPIRRISSDEMAAGAKGYADHWTVTRAFGKSSHTDLGSSFPWDVLAADIAALIGDDMNENTRVYDSRNSRPFGAGEVRHVDLDAAPNSLVSVTLSGQQAVGFLTVWGAGSRPDTAACFCRPDWAINTTIVRTDSTGGINVYASHGGHVVVDAGYVLS